MKKVLSVILLALCVTSIYAQGQWEIHGGLSLPNGKFSDDNPSKTISQGNGSNGGAGTGVNVGMKYLIPVQKADNLFLSVGLDFRRNNCLALRS